MAHQKFSNGFKITAWPLDWPTAGVKEVKELCEGGTVAPRRNLHLFLRGSSFKKQQMRKNERRLSYVPLLIACCTWFSAGAVSLFFLPAYLPSLGMDLCIRVLLWGCEICWFLDHNWPRVADWPIWRVNAVNEWVFVSAQRTVQRRAGGWKWGRAAFIARLLGVLFTLRLGLDFFHHP